MSIKKLYFLILIDSLYFKYFIITQKENSFKRNPIIIKLPNVKKSIYYKFNKWKD